MQQSVRSIVLYCDNEHSMKDYATMYNAIFSVELLHKRLRQVFDYLLCSRKVMY